MAGGKRRGGRGGRRGGEGDGMPRNVQISKKLSWLLRHGAEKEGLTLGPGGYVNVKEVVSKTILWDVESSVPLKSHGMFTVCLSTSTVLTATKSSIIRASSDISAARFPCIEISQSLT